MAKMRLPIVLVFRSNSIIADHKQIFRVLLVGRFREVERAGKYCRAINYHDLVVRDCVH